MTNNNDKKVIVAMSGGVDSSVTAFLLMQAGYDVVGATIITGYGNPGEQAKLICEQLGICHYFIDAKEQFQQQVVEPFIAEYYACRTPNPCVECNARLKFPVFLPLMQELSADYLATGHYVRIKEQQGRFLLQRAVCDEKDQTYFMYKLGQNILRHCLFPLGEYSKQQVRQIAEEQGLASARQKDSYDICFIEDGNYRNLLDSWATSENACGNILNIEGDIIGQHKGLTNYTLGQRKGLEIALGYPAYVVDISKQDNTVTLGERDELLTSSIMVEDVNFLPFDKLLSDIEAQVRVRYKAAPVWARLSPQGNKVKIEFSEPVWAATPGQSAVFYDEDDSLIGGGVIV